MPFSIGLEIEGIALARASSSTALPSRLEDQLSLVANALRDADIPSRVYIPSSTRGSGPDYDVWNITTDATISELTSGSESDLSVFQTRYGFELISPIFNVVGDEWKNTLERALESIGDVIKWKANRSTGLHVHLGHLKDAPGFTLEQLKRVAMLYCRFEDAIDEFHPMHRQIDNDNILSNRHNDLLNASSLSEVYSIIQAAPDTATLCSIMNHAGGTDRYDGYSDSRFFKVNFTSLQKHGTIEFRQHQGTTMPAAIIKWIRFIIIFVEFALTAPLDVITAPGETFEDMARLIRQ